MSTKAPKSKRPARAKIAPEKPEGRTLPRRLHLAVERIRDRISAIYGRHTAAVTNDDVAAFALRQHEKDRDYLYRLGIGLVAEEELVKWAKGIKRKGR